MKNSAFSKRMDVQLKPHVPGNRVRHLGSTTCLSFFSRAAIGSMHAVQDGATFSRMWLVSRRTKMPTFVQVEGLPVQDPTFRLRTVR